MADSVITVELLKKRVEQFVVERDWRQFHTPKNLAMSVAIEAAELMEHFQWNDPKKEDLTPEKRIAIEDEIADVFAHLLSLCRELDIDLSDVVERKMKKNELRYPIEQSKSHRYFAHRAALKAKKE